MLKSQMITSKHYFLISVLEGMKANLKSDERIIWEMGFPMVIKKHPVSLWLERTGKEVLRVTLGIRKHYRMYKRRIK